MKNSIYDSFLQSKLRFLIEDLAEEDIRHLYLNNYYWKQPSYILCFACKNLPLDILEKAIKKLDDSFIHYNKILSMKNDYTNDNLKNCLEGINWLFEIRTANIQHFQMVNMILEDRLSSDVDIFREIKAKFKSHPKNLTTADFILESLLKNN